MTFSLPEDLAPELYPLAWLVGTWRGYGVLTYGETIPEQAVYQEIVFDHDGGPYLRQVTTVWTLDATRSEDLDFEVPGLEGAARIAPARIWSSETAYWRPVGQESPDADDADTRTPITRLEVVSADPAGQVGVWEGWIQGPALRSAPRPWPHPHQRPHDRDDPRPRARGRRSHVGAGHGRLRPGPAELRLRPARAGRGPR
ncbi:hypothetical protein ADENT20671_1531 [Actinomyces denticolens]|nr:hypothetical protein ADENT20671_1531 [Actinomyces denticolens]